MEKNRGTTPETADLTAPGRTDRPWKPPREVPVGKRNLGLLDLVIIGGFLQPLILPHSMGAKRGQFGRSTAGLLFAVTSGPWLGREGELAGK